MIDGAHVVLSSRDPKADRAFLRDVLGLQGVDAGDGWLIFALPPADVAVHPSERNDAHELYLMCDDVRAGVAAWAARGVACDPVQDLGWGLLTRLTLPGGGRLGVYQPRHARPAPIAGAAGGAADDPEAQERLWRQFGAAIDMLANAVAACPEPLWGDRTRQPEFWYLVYHTLFWLDLYLSGAVAGFAPPEPFTLDELDPKGLKPERVYAKHELMAYLRHGREKCRAAIAASTPASTRRRHAFGWGEVSGGELFLYNLRHVQHHAGQLHLILRQATDSTPGWVGRAKEDVGGR